MTLETDLLRSFLAVIDAGSISSAAERIGRTQSAVSLQIKRLEEVTQTPVFERHGRGVSLSEAGKRLEPVARQAVRLLDNSLAQIRSDDLSGTLHIGIPDDRGKTKLANMIAHFTRQHPQVDLNVHCASGAGFGEAIRRGNLDMAVYEVETVLPRHHVLREERTRWVASSDHAPQDIDPLPVALFDDACWWRDVALDTLRRSGSSYRVVFSSESVSGITAAVDAGIAVALLGESTIADNHRILESPEFFDQTPTSRLVLDRRTGSHGPVIDAMSDVIRSTFEGEQRTDGTNA